MNFFFNIYYILIFLYLISYNLGSQHADLYTKQPLWTWTCLEDKCIPSRPTEDVEPQSLETCNMLCSSLHIWPHPTGNVKLSITAVPIRADLIHFQLYKSPSRIVSEYIKDAFEIFRANLKKQEIDTSLVEWHSLLVRVDINRSRDPRMLVDTDESYTLSMNPIQNSKTSQLVNITANSFCGARHALETLSQLIWYDTYKRSLFILDAGSIEDAPIFSYRGLLLDTSRNYFSVTDIMRLIDGMSMNKLNTFHWHATDSTAFSLQLKTAPEFAGAYGSTAIYTLEQIKKIVRHAKLRGIRVLIEVDVPAHVGNTWTWTHNENAGNLSLCVESDHCAEPPCGQLNPKNDRVYEMLEQIYAEILQITDTDDIIHIGGDDISKSCWDEVFAPTDPISLGINFTKIFFSKLEYINGKLPNLTILWSSELVNRFRIDLKEYLPYIGLQMRGVKWGTKIINGVRNIISHENAWDLNSGYSSWYDENSGVPYNSWQHVYDYRPWAHSGAGWIIGGEATIWATTLSASGLDMRVWPRAAAFAERLWSDRIEGVTKTVEARMDVQRFRMVNRGINANPIWSMWCTQNPYTC